MESIDQAIKSFDKAMLAADELSRSIDKMHEENRKTRLILLLTIVFAPFIGGVLVLLYLR